MRTSPKRGQDQKFVDLNRFSAHRNAYSFYCCLVSCRSSHQKCSLKTETVQFPLEITHGQFPPSVTPLQTIAPRQGPPRITDPLDRWSLGISHLGLFQLVWLPQEDYASSKFFTVFHFAFFKKPHLKQAETCNTCYNKKSYKHKHAFISTLSSSMRQAKFLSRPILLKSGWNWNLKFGQAKNLCRLI